MRQWLRANRASIQHIAGCGNTFARRAAHVDTLALHAQWSFAAVTTEMFDFVTYRGAILPWHCDHMGHMNVMWYVGKFDEATWHFFAHIGLTPSYFRGEAFGMAA